MCLWFCTVLEGDFDVGKSSIHFAERRVVRGRHASGKYCGKVCVQQLICLLCGDDVSDVDFLVCTRTGCLLNIDTQRFSITTFEQGTGEQNAKRRCPGVWTSMVFVAMLLAQTPLSNEHAKRLQSLASIQMLGGHESDVHSENEQWY